MLPPHTSIMCKTCLWQHCPVPDTLVRYDPNNDMKTIIKKLTHVANILMEVNSTSIIQ